MGKESDMPFVGGPNPTGRGQNIMNSGVKIQRIGFQNTMGSGIDIPLAGDHNTIDYHGYGVKILWIWGRYTIGRGLKHQG